MRQDTILFQDQQPAYPNDNNDKIGIYIHCMIRLSHTVALTVFEFVKHSKSTFY